MSWLEHLRARLDALLHGDGDGDDGGIEQSGDGERMELKFDSSTAHLAAVRKRVEVFAAAHGLDAPACQELGLVVNEALANVIRHAYDNTAGKPVQLWAQAVAPVGVRIGIRDWGNGVDPSTLPEKPHDPLTPGGLGLVCMKRLMDQVEYLPQSDGMLLTMTRTRSGSRMGDSPCPSGPV